MSDSKTIAVTLDVTVHVAQWRDQIGGDTDVVRDLPGLAAGWVAMAPRLLEHNATVALIAGADVTAVDARQSGFITVRLALEVTIPATVWRAAYGLDAQDGIPSYVAQFNGPGEFRDAVRATVILVGSMSGLVVGDEVITVQRRRR